MKRNPLVSIVIPAYNASNYLAEAIDSALAQTYSNVEIIVVNDGSNDNGATKNVAMSYGDKIRYYEKENGGSSSALNLGIKHMNGEWFSWLSHDDLYYPDKIQKEIEYLENTVIAEKDYQNHVLFSAYELINSEGLVIRRESNRKRNKTNIAIESIEHNAYLISQPRKYNFHGCSCLIHKSVFETVGVFDEQLRLLNDVEMWFRIHAKGYVIHYVPKILVKGRVHSKQVSNTIGYSVNHPEQDMLWNRRIEWLNHNHMNCCKVFELLGRDAYLCGRITDGQKAFEIVKSIQSNKTLELLLKKNVYLLINNIRLLLKKIYMMFRL